MKVGNMEFTEYTPYLDCTTGDNSKLFSHSVTPYGGEHITVFYLPADNRVRAHWGSLSVTEDTLDDALLTLFNQALGALNKMFVDLFVAEVDE
jgi:hypothetical protein